MKKIIILLLAVCLIQLAQYGQAQDENFELPTDWYHLDLAQDEVIGVSAYKAYKKVIKRKKGEQVLVAVIDSGIEIDHEDLRNVIWINQAELANGIDEDGNGYVDDINGWSFIGGADGDIHYDNLEITRLVRHYSTIFDGMDSVQIVNEKADEYAYFLQLKEDFEGEYMSNSQQAQFYNVIYDTFKKVLGLLEDGTAVEDLELEDPRERMIAGMVAKAMSEGASKDELTEELRGAIDYFNSKVEYHLNLDFDPRAIVGDDYSNANERYYGNNHVTGPDAMHGTHVAGIIAAERNNDLGIDGLAHNVKIITIRAVPDGDERDKDVANAIRYAVDNGAKVINMSFGKAYVWNKEVVDEAITYAIEKDVLLVHAAGNEAKNTDLENNFPNADVIAEKNLADAWIEVGASTWMNDENLVAPFSNYGKERVDLFAPGASIYSTVLDNEYKAVDGTSMAAPVVAGIAASIRSLYPLYSAADVKSILMRSAHKIDHQVNKPGSEDELVSFNELCKSGAIVNMHDALQLAKKEYRAKKKSLK